MALDVRELITPRVLIAGAVISVSLLGRALVSYFWSPSLPNVIFSDLKDLGKPRAKGKIKGTAVICGGR